MTLDELLALDRPPDELALPPAEIKKWFWKYRGLLKEQERNQAFWNATNKNLKLAYDKLDQKDRLLAEAYDIIQDDLSVAQRIQTALLPTSPAAVADLVDIAVYHKQLNEVGGDYYDYFVTEAEADTPQRVAIGLFDISGHGVSAALVMTYLKAMFMQAIQHQATPQEAVGWVNSSCIGFLKQVKKYATVNYLQLLADRVSYVCGGGFGMVVPAGGGDVHHFVRKDHFLGLRDRTFHQYETSFGVGDLMALYTDGIVEAQNEAGEDYTAKRLNDLLVANADKPVADIVDICMRDYQTFRQADMDDITLVVLRRKAG